MKPAFDLKSTRLDAVSIHLHRADIADIAVQLQERANGYQTFAGMPFALNLQTIGLPEAGQLAAIIAEFAQHGLPICALQHDSDDAAWQHIAAAHGLAFCSNPRKNATAHHTSQPNDETATETSETADIAPETVATTTDAATPTETAPPARRTIVIERPVRTGQQVYAEHADLIVMGMVSEGAEVIADGHIHIYAPMRGRALAGANGDTSARIFIQNMQAELVSVAGIYRTFDQDLPKHLQNQAVQVRLEEQRLVLAALDGRKIGH